MNTVVILKPVENAGDVEQFIEYYGRCPTDNDRVGNYLLRFLKEEPEPVEVATAE